MTKQLENLFTTDALAGLFPDNRADRFFDALYGDVDEGAYDIGLAFKSAGEDRLLFEFRLLQREGKCLACNLTYGLPTVFSKHPIINVAGVVEKIDAMLDGQAKVDKWVLGSTKEISRTIHVIPLTLYLTT